MTSLQHQNTFEDSEIVDESQFYNLNVDDIEDDLNYCDSFTPTMNSIEKKIVNVVEEDYYTTNKTTSKELVNLLKNKVYSTPVAPADDRPGNPKTQLSVYNPYLLSSRKYNTQKNLMKIRYLRFLTKRQDYIKKNVDNLNAKFRVIAIKLIYFAGSTAIKYYLSGPATMYFLNFLSSPETFFSGYKLDALTLLLESSGAVQTYNINALKNTVNLVKKHFESKLDKSLIDDFKNQRWKDENGVPTKLARMWEKYITNDKNQNYFDLVISADVGSTKTLSDFVKNTTGYKVATRLYETDYNKIFNNIMGTVTEDQKAEMADEPVQTETEKTPPEKIPEHLIIPDKPHLEQLVRIISDIKSINVGFTGLLKHAFDPTLAEIINDIVHIGDDSKIIDPAVTINNKFRQTLMNMTRSKSFVDMVNNGTFMIFSDDDTNPAVSFIAQYISPGFLVSSTLNEFVVKNISLLKEPDTTESQDAKKKKIVKERIEMRMKYYQKGLSRNMVNNIIEETYYAKYKSSMVKALRRAYYTGDYGNINKWSTFVFAGSISMFIVPTFFSGLILSDLNSITLLVSSLQTVAKGVALNENAIREWAEIFGRYDSSKSWTDMLIEMWSHTPNPKEPTIFGLKKTQLINAITVPLTKIIEEIQLIVSDITRFINENFNHYGSKTKNVIFKHMYETKVVRVLVSGSLMMFNYMFKLMSSSAQYQMSTNLRKYISSLNTLDVIEKISFKNIFKSLEWINLNMPSILTWFHSKKNAQTQDLLGSVIQASLSDTPQITNGNYMIGSLLAKRPDLDSEWRECQPGWTATSCPWSWKMNHILSSIISATSYYLGDTHFDQEMYFNQLQQNLDKNKIEEEGSTIVAFNVNTNEVAVTKKRFNDPIINSDIMHLVFHDFIDVLQKSDRYKTDANFKKDISDSLAELGPRSSSWIPGSGSGIKFKDLPIFSTSAHKEIFMKYVEGYASEKRWSSNKSTTFFKLFGVTSITPEQEDILQNYITSMMLRKTSSSKADLLLNVPVGDCTQIVDPSCATRTLDETMKVININQISIKYNLDMNDLDKSIHTLFGKLTQQQGYDGHYPIGNVVGTTYTMIMDDSYFLGDRESGEPVNCTLDKMTREQKENIRGMKEFINDVNVLNDYVRSSYTAGGKYRGNELKLKFAEPMSCEFVHLQQLLGLNGQDTDWLLNQTEQQDLLTKSKLNTFHFKRKVRGDPESKKKLDFSSFGLARLLHDIKDEDIVSLDDGKQQVVLRKKQHYFNWMGLLEFRDIYINQNVEDVLFPTDESFTDHVVSPFDSLPDDDGKEVKTLVAKILTKMNKILEEERKNGHDTDRLKGEFEIIKQNIQSQTTELGIMIELLKDTKFFLEQTTSSLLSRKFNSPFKQVYRELGMIPINTDHLDDIFTMTSFQQGELKTWVAKMFKKVYNYDIPLDQINPLTMLPIIYHPLTRETVNNPKDPLAPNQSVKDSLDRISTHILGEKYNALRPTGGMLTNNSAVELEIRSKISEFVYKEMFNAWTRGLGKTDKKYKWVSNIDEFLYSLPESQVKKLPKKHKDRLLSRRCGTVPLLPCPKKQDNEIVLYYGDDDMLLKENLTLFEDTFSKEKPRDQLEFLRLLNHLNYYYRSQSWKTDYYDLLSNVLGTRIMNPHNPILGHFSENRGLDCDILSVLTDDTQVLTQECGEQILTTATYQKDMEYNVYPLTTNLQSLLAGKLDPKKLDFRVYHIDINENEIDITNDLNPVPSNNNHKFKIDEDLNIPESDKIVIKRIPKQKLPSRFKDKDEVEAWSTSQDGLQWKNNINKIMPKYIKTDSILGKRYYRQVNDIETLISVCSAAVRDGNCDLSELNDAFTDLKKTCKEIFKEAVTVDSKEREYLDDFDTLLIDFRNGIPGKGVFDRESGIDKQVDAIKKDLQGFLKSLDDYVQQQDSGDEAIPGVTFESLSTGSTGSTGSTASSGPTGSTGGPVQAQKPTETTAEKQGEEEDTKEGTKEGTKEDVEEKVSEEMAEQVSEDQDYLEDMGIGETQAEDQALSESLKESLENLFASVSDFLGRSNVGSTSAKKASSGTSNLRANPFDTDVPPPQEDIDKKCQALSSSWSPAGQFRKDHENKYMVSSSSISAKDREFIQKYCNKDPVGMKNLEDVKKPTQALLRMLFSGASNIIVPLGTVVSGTLIAIFTAIYTLSGPAGWVAGAAFVSASSYLTSYINEYVNNTARIMGELTDGYNYISTSYKLTSLYVDIFCPKYLLALNNIPDGGFYYENNYYYAKTGIIYKNKSDADSKRSPINLKDNKGNDISPTDSVSINIEPSKNDIVKLREELLGINDAEPSISANELNFKRRLLLQLYQIVGSQTFDDVAGYGVTFESKVYNFFGHGDKTTTKYKNLVKSSDGIMSKVIFSLWNRGSLDQLRSVKSWREKPKEPSISSIDDKKKSVTTLLEYGNYRNKYDYGDMLNRLGSIQASLSMVEDSEVVREISDTSRRLMQKLAKIATAAKSLSKTAIHDLLELNSEIDMLESRAVTLVSNNPNLQDYLYGSVSMQKYILMLIHENPIEKEESTEINERVENSLHKALQGSKISNYYLRYCVTNMLGTVDYLVWFTNSILSLFIKIVQEILKVARWIPGLGTAVAAADAALQRLKNGLDGTQKAISDLINSFGPETSNEEHRTISDTKYQYKMDPSKSLPLIFTDNGEEVRLEQKGSSIHLINDKTNNIIKSNIGINTGTEIYLSIKIDKVTTDSTTDYDVLDFTGDVVGFDISDIDSLFDDDTEVYIDGKDIKLKATTSAKTSNIGVIKGTEVLLNKENIYHNKDFPMKKANANIKVTANIETVKKHSLKNDWINKNFSDFICKFQMSLNDKAGVAPYIQTAIQGLITALNYITKKLGLTNFAIDVNMFQYAVNKFSRDCQTVNTTAMQNPVAGTSEELIMNSFIKYTYVPARASKPSNFNDLVSLMEELDPTLQTNINTNHQYASLVKDHELETNINVKFRPKCPPGSTCPPEKFMLEVSSATAPIVLKPGSLIIIGKDDRDKPISVRVGGDRDIHINAGTTPEIPLDYDPGSLLASKEDTITSYLQTNLGKELSDSGLPDIYKQIKIAVDEETFLRILSYNMNINSLEVAPGQAIPFINDFKTKKYISYSPVYGKYSAIGSSKKHIMAADFANWFTREHYVGNVKEGLKNVEDVFKHWNTDKHYILSEDIAGNPLRMIYTTSDYCDKDDIPEFCTRANNDITNIRDAIYDPHNFKTGYPKGIKDQTHARLVDPDTYYRVDGSGNHLLEFQAQTEDRFQMNFIAQATVNQKIPDRFNFRDTHLNVELIYGLYGIDPPPVANDTNPEIESNLISFNSNDEPVYPDLNKLINLVNSSGNPELISTKIPKFNEVYAILSSDGLNNTLEYFNLKGDDLDAECQKFKEFVYKLTLLTQPDQFLSYKSDVLICNEVCKKDQYCKDAFSWLKSITTKDNVFDEDSKKINKNEILLRDLTAIQQTIWSYANTLPIRQSESRVLKLEGPIVYENEQLMDYTGVEDLGFTIDIDIYEQTVNSSVILQLRDPVASTKKGINVGHNNIPYQEKEGDKDKTIKPTFIFEKQSENLSPYLQTIVSNEYTKINIISCDDQYSIDPNTQEPLDYYVFSPPQSGGGFTTMECSGEWVIESSQDKIEEKTNSGWVERDPDRDEWNKNWYYTQHQKQRWKDNVASKGWVYDCEVKEDRTVIIQKGKVAPPDPPTPESTPCELTVESIGELTDTNQRVVSYNVLTHPTGNDSKGNPYTCGDEEMDDADAVYNRGQELKDKYRVKPYESGDLRRIITFDRINCQEQPTGNETSCTGADQLAQNGDKFVEYKITDSKYGGEKCKSGVNPPEGYTKRDGYIWKKQNCQINNWWNKDRKYKQAFVKTDAFNLMKKHMINDNTTLCWDRLQQDKELIKQINRLLIPSKMPDIVSFYNPLLK